MYDYYFLLFLSVSGKSFKLVHQGSVPILISSNSHWSTAYKRAKR